MADDHAGQFGKGAGDQRRAGRSAEPGAIDGAAGQRVDILERPGDFDADAGRRRHRAGRSGRPVPQRAPRSGSASSPASVTAVGRPAATSAAKLGPDSTIGNGGRRHVGEDFALPLQRAGFEALGRQHHRLAGELRGSIAPRAARLACAGTARMTRSASGRRRAAGDRCRAALTRRRCALLRVAAVDLVDRRRVAADQRHRAPGHGRGLRQRRAPGAGADDGDAFKRHGLSPMSAQSSGQRALAEKSSASAAPRASRSAPAQATMAPLSVQSGMGGMTSVAPAASAASRKAPCRSPCWRRRHRQRRGAAAGPGSSAANCASADAGADGDDLGHGCLEAGADIGDILVAERRQLPRPASRTAVLRPEKEKSSRSSCSSGRGKLEALADRPIQRHAARPAGPPGWPRPRSLATLSKASPSASSMVVPQRS